MLKLAIFIIIVSITSKLVESIVPESHSNPNSANNGKPTENKIRNINIQLDNDQEKKSDKEIKIVKLPDSEKPVKKITEDNKSNEVKEQIQQKNDIKPNSGKDSEPQKKVGSEMSTVSVNISKSYSKELLQSGALLRGFYVFLGLSAVTVFYFVYRSYRLRHGSQVSTTVKKYGVTARRSDLEMRHLELDDDEDDTLFEINQNINR